MGVVVTGRHAKWDYRPPPSWLHTWIIIVTAYAYVVRGLLSFFYPWGDRRLLFSSLMRSKTVGFSLVGDGDGFISAGFFGGGVS